MLGSLRETTSLTSISGKKPSRFRIPSSGRKPDVRFQRRLDSRAARWERACIRRAPSISVVHRRARACPPEDGGGMGQLSRSHARPKARRTRSDCDSGRWSVRSIRLRRHAVNRNLQARQSPQRVQLNAPGWAAQGCVAAPGHLTAVQALIVVPEIPWHGRVRDAPCHERR